MSFREQFVVKGIDSIRLEGTKVSATKAGTTNPIRVLIYDEDKDILWATGTDVPADTTGGYAKGCLFVDKDVAAGTSGLYVNVGTNSSCNFDLVTDA